MVAMGMVSSPPHVEETPCRGKIQSLGYMPAEGVMRFICSPLEGNRFIYKSVLSLECIHPLCWMSTENHIILLTAALV